MTGTTSAAATTASTVVAAGQEVGLTGDRFAVLVLGLAFVVFCAAACMAVLWGR